MIISRAISDAKENRIITALPSDGNAMTRGSANDLDCIIRSIPESILLKCTAVELAELVEVMASSIVMARQPELKRRMK